MNLNSKHINTLTKLEALALIEEFKLPTKLPRPKKSVVLCKENQGHYLLVNINNKLYDLVFTKELI